ncbi:uncharacterized protein LOC130991510 [Salvia miltiorrhiza]|uniref:uncharacterized protein LOC130991510 n=1 Tax=Salvia miltiorrhiza TaxID=226208 RepID=UPI0025ABD7AB|nr:uncharacterized protein LOC130991510 [Salvia miltiorrhiza]
MSVKKNEMEEEKEERELVDHWNHGHPLTLVEIHDKTDYCNSCIKYFSSGEKAYRCSQEHGGLRFLLHQECAGLPRKIKHAMHPHHILTQVFVDRLEKSKSCALCKDIVTGMFYVCARAGCIFAMHIRCTLGSGVIDAAEDEDDDGQSGGIIDHPSHPRHRLRFVRRRCSFMCDACGTTHEGRSYMCCRANCQYWIHERCASLPQTIEREDHHHSLSLSFHVPPLYLKYNYRCDVCSKYLLPRYWIYHCQLCSYVVHLKCAFNKSSQVREKNDDEKKIIVFPISDVGEDQIGAFVKRQGGTISIPPIPHHDVDYEFHKHKLRLVSASSSSEEEEEEEEEENSDDDGEDHYGRQKSELICDACITPIFRKQRSSSSSRSKDYCYMSCSSGCNYNLHMACFHLPPRLPYISLHHRSGHHLILGTFDKLRYNRCRVCGCYSDGLIYKCTKCSFKADIKCASMPDTIYHTAHPQHPLNLLQRPNYYCDANCGDRVHMYACYACNNCDFLVHTQCAMLPASIIIRRWDKHHPLPLTYNANLNHPGEFYCNECETEMSPKSWMYHCRHCDISFHPKCFKTTSGQFRNIKFGKEYVNTKAHPHPLAYQLLTTKRRCDGCDEDKYERPGLHCASCNFFICLYCTMLIYSMT